MAYDLKATLSINASRFNSGIAGAARQLKQMSGSVTQAERQVSGMGSTLKKVAGVAAGFIAVDKIKDLGVSAVQAAADMEATQAQFSQVFGAMEGDATNAVAKMGKEFGMMPNRLTGNMSQVTAQFKGLGLSTKDAMGEATKAMTVAADASAFYDKSMEDSASALNSFIKGSYEGGESIGLFANETQMASWAAKNLGVDWKSLDEAGKQVARLDFATAMQKAAGATGQASRESDSLANQLGNVKASWSEFIGTIATPILPLVVDGMKQLAGWVSSVDTAAIISGFQTFGTYMSDTFTPILDSFKTVAEGAWSAFENMGGVTAAKEALDGVKSGLAWMSDNSALVVSAITGIGAAIGTLKVITTINAGIAAARTLWGVYAGSAFAATVAQHGLNAAMRANPIGIVITAIGLLVSAGVLLYQNWDVVKKKAGELWSKVKEVFGNIADWASQKLAPVSAFFSDMKDKFDAFKDSITSFTMPGWVSSIGDTIGGAASKMKGLFGGGGKSHAGGLSYVPSNGYQATLHKGERVLTPEENKAYTNGGGRSIVFEGGIHISGIKDLNGAADQLMRIITDRIETAGGAGA